jgi:hypothetical protein
MAAIAELRPGFSGVEDLQLHACAKDPEFDLLLACCAGPEQGDRIPSLLSSPLDWERMLSLVEHHRVVKQVYGKLSGFLHLVPVPFFNALRSRYQDNARNALWLTAELVRIVRHLELSGINAVPYKGPVLAEALYGEVIGRQFSDLDILIPPADVPKAKAALLELGYKPGIELARGQERAYIAAGYEMPFRAASGGNLLELHWQILPRFYSIDLNVADLLERAEEISFNGSTLRTLRAEDLLLVLCVHAAKHAWVQLSWLCDIAQVAKSRQLDWNAIRDESRRLGIARIVNLNLLLAHKLLGGPLPFAIQKSLLGSPKYTQSNCHSERSEESAVASNRKSADSSRQERTSGMAVLAKDPSTNVLADEILRIIEHSAHYDTESLPYFRMMIRLRERHQDQRRFLWRLVVTPSVSEWSAVQLPKSLQPLYRLVRLSRLVKRLASAILMCDENGSR